MRICIVVPMYNEETIIKQSITTIVDYAKKLPPLVTAVAVNDGSQDNTENILQDLAKQYKEDEFQFISHSHNMGYGAALRTGTKFAIDNAYDYVIFMDSDLTNHPKYLNEFHRKINDGWEYIKATRYSKGGGTEGVPLVHKTVSIIGNFIAKFLYGLPLTDLTNGFRAVKVDILKQMYLSEGGFSIIMEELFQAKSLTHSFCEIPYILTTRKMQDGQTHFSYGPRQCMRYLKYAFKSFFEKR